MKKVLAYVGSRNPKSKGLTYVRELATELAGEDIEFDIVTAEELTLHPVMGSDAFITGKDDVDDEGGDSGEYIKNKLLEADFIIFTTPVYSHAVSSDFKRLIERLSYWLHIFRLLGKPGISVVAASSNGFMEVQEYVDYVMGSLGIQVVESVILLDRDIKGSDSVERGVQAIKHALGPDYRIKLSTITEQQFRTYQRTYKPLSRELAEPRYWEEKGWFNYRKLQHYVDDVLQGD